MAPCKGFTLPSPGLVHVGVHSGDGLTQLCRVSEGTAPMSDHTQWMGCKKNEREALTCAQIRARPQTQTRTQGLVTSTLTRKNMYTHAQAQRPISAVHDSLRSISVAHMPACGAAPRGDLSLQDVGDGATESDTLSMGKKILIKLIYIGWSVFLEVLTRNCKLLNIYICNIFGGYIYQSMNL